MNSSIYISNMIIVHNIVNTEHIFSQTSSAQLIKCISTVCACQSMCVTCECIS